MPAAEVVGALGTRFSATPYALGVELHATALLEAARALRDAHGYRYYVLDDPEIGDDHYDALLDDLRAIEAERR